ncbi:MAG: hypothetical protein RLZZ223_46, partial [Candidatus Parcubacteria bacterium]
MILSSQAEIPKYIFEYYQSPDWAKFISKDYLKVERILIKDNLNQPTIFAQIYIYKLIHRYNQIYIPRGPILYKSNLSKSEIQEFWDNIKNLSKKYNAVFTLIEPAQDIYNNYYQLFQQVKIRVSKVERLPHQTQIMDLSLSEDDLLKNMHSKMRYNIRLAKKKGVQIKTIQKKNKDFDKYFNNFIELMQETSQRGVFSIHRPDHYRHLLELVSSDLKTSLIVAEHDNKILAANIILDTTEQRIYLHGASSSQNRNLMAPPLLQWESILEAKKNAKKFYDFWGISNTKKSWGGIS